MNVVRMSSDRLAELVGRFSRARVAVLGDFFLDKYLDVDPALAEKSVETGKVAHQVVGIRCSPGAAGTVVSNLAALQAGAVHAVGFTGDDGEGFDLRTGLARLGCTTDHLSRCAERSTPTYLKPRDVRTTSLEGEHSRYDTKNRTATLAEIERSILRSLDQLLGEVDAFIVLDQVDEVNCGVVTDRVRQALSDRARKTPQVVFWADSRRAIREFSGMIIKPNQFEAIGLEQPLPGQEVDWDRLVAAARELRHELGAPVVVTRSAGGMLVSDPQWTRVPGVVVEGEIDPTGAGDSATAGAVLALCAGAELPEAALVGNLVASITIQQINTTGVARPDQLLPRLEMWQRQQDAIGNP
jgi:rfaE bifunctional protein kinase chain/domain